MLLTGTILNYIGEKKWYNLMQLAGSIGFILPIGIRLLLYRMFPKDFPITGNENIAIVLSWATTIGVIVFIFGYLSMSIEKMKITKLPSGNPAPHDS
jgi:hypothetical protein